MKKTSLALLLALLLLLAACAPQPESEYENYFGMSQWTQGGSKQDLMHVTDIRVEERGETSAVILEFGREKSGMVEAAKPPRYVVDALSSPGRIVIGLSGIVAWDASIPPLVGEGALVRGCFRINRNKDAQAYLYVQLSKDVAWRLEEGETSLTLIVRPLAQQDASEAWYAVADAVSDYESGNLGDKSGMTPALCRDGSRLLLSSAYASEEEAQAAADSVSDALASVNGKKAVVQKLARNALPDYTDGISAELLAEARLFEGKGTLTYWQHGMRFLGWSPEGKALMARRSSVADYSELEELWEYDREGNSRQLIEQPFSAVGDAKYSPDGSLLAFTEVTDKNRRLYIARVATGDLFYPDDQTYISGFDWGNDGRLYYMGGEEYVALIAYDPATDIMQYLEDIVGVEGDFATSEGYVLFTDDLSSVYRLHPENGQRIKIATGAEFRLSPDGKSIALLAYDEETELDTYSVLSVMDFLTRTVTPISIGRMLGDACWDVEGDVLYYALFRENTESYIFDLFAYSPATGESTPIGMADSMQLHAGTAPGEMIVNMNVPVGEDDYISAVYLLSIEKEGEE